MQTRYKITKGLCLLIPFFNFENFKTKINKFISTIWGTLLGPNSLDSTCKSLNVESVDEMGEQKI